jgi:hypothetical protein
MVLYASSLKRTMLPSSTVYVYGIVLTEVKRIGNEGKPNWNKCTVTVLKRFLIINNAR